MVPKTFLYEVPTANVPLSIDRLEITELLVSSETSDKSPIQQFTLGRTENRQINHTNLMIESDTPASSLMRLKLSNTLMTLQDTRRRPAQAMPSGSRMATR